MGEVAQLITAIGGALGVVLTPIVTLLIARSKKADSDTEQDKRIAELERQLTDAIRQREQQPRHRRTKG